MFICFYDELKRSIWAETNYKNVVVPFSFANGLYELGAGGDFIDESFWIFNEVNDRAVFILVVCSV